MLDIRLTQYKTYAHIWGDTRICECVSRKIIIEKMHFLRVENSQLHVETCSFLKYFYITLSKKALFHACFSTLFLDWKCFGFVCCALGFKRVNGISLFQGQPNVIEALHQTPTGVIIEFEGNNS